MYSDVWASKNQIGYCLQFEVRLPDHPNFSYFTDPVTHNPYYRYFGVKISFPCSYTQSPPQTSFPDFFTMKHG